MFPTASNLFRPRRGVHQLPGEMVPLFPLSPILFDRCLALPNSDGTVALFCPRWSSLSLPSPWAWLRRASTVSFDRTTTAATSR
jgi:hypothetical protein